MNRVRVLSLGAGIQSSALAMMYERGDLENPPHFAIFAVTGAEPKAVYDYLHELQSRITKFPIHIFSHGNIVIDTLLSSKFASAPFYIKKPDGKVGMGRRQCTREYKIHVIQQGIRKVLGYKKHKWMRHEIDMIIGISTDEIQRMRTSDTKWITNCYPLIDELNMSRDDCIKYFSDCNLPTPARSACWMCPYRSDDEWKDLRDNHPKEFKLAVEFDARIRKLAKFDHENYLHQSCLPLDEALTRHDEPDIFERMADWNNECEGMCGL